MSQVLSEKKKFAEKGYFSENKHVNLHSFLEKYGNLFKVYRRNNTSKAYAYLLGLMKCEKNHTNMERMVEQVPEQAYHQYHNFLSESKWDYEAVNKQTALDVSVLMKDCKFRSGKPTGSLMKAPI